MSITFRIGKDNITRTINTCLLPLEFGKDEKRNKRYLQNCPMENMSLAILMRKETKTHFQTVRWRTCHLKCWGKGKMILSNCSMTNMSFKILRKQGKMVLSNCSTKNMPFEILRKQGKMVLSNCSMKNMPFEILMIGDTSGPDTSGDDTFVRYSWNKTQGGQCNYV